VSANPAARVGGAVPLVLFVDPHVERLLREPCLSARRGRNVLANPALGPSAVPRGTLVVGAVPPRAPRHRSPGNLFQPRVPRHRCHALVRALLVMTHQPRGLVAALRDCHAHHARAHRSHCAPSRHASPHPTTTTPTAHLAPRSSLHSTQLKSTQLNSKPPTSAHLLRRAFCAFCVMISSARSFPGAESPPNGVPPLFAAPPVSRIAPVTPEPWSQKLARMKDNFQTLHIGNPSSVGKGIDGKKRDSTVGYP